MALLQHSKAVRMLVAARCAGASGGAPLLYAAAASAARFCSAGQPPQLPGPPHPPEDIAPATPLTGGTKAGKGLLAGLLATWRIFLPNCRSQPPGVLLIGNTGTGKSTLGNLLVGRRDVFAVSDGFDPVTQGPQLARLEAAGGRGLNVMDTPGFSDRGGDVADTERANQLAEFLRGKDLAAVVFVFNAAQPRFTGQDRINISVIGHILGRHPEVFRNTAVVFMRSSGQDKQTQAYAAEVRRFMSRHVAPGLGDGSAPAVFNLDAADRYGCEVELERMRVWLLSRPAVKLTAPQPVQDVRARCTYNTREERPVGAPYAKLEEETYKAWEHTVSQLVHNTVLGTGAGVAVGAVIMAAGLSGSAGLGTLLALSSTAGAGIGLKFGPPESRMRSRKVERMYRKYDVYDVVNQVSWTGEARKLSETKVDEVERRVAS